MKCWHCETEAKAICVFCGRGVCIEHRQSKEHFIGYGKKHAGGMLELSSTTAANVPDASWCGVCNIEYVDSY